MGGMDRTMENFKKSTIYQIYPKSFCDSNGDGIGDIPGIISKLDYIKSLGVDYIWSTPFFTSPLKDNGYDVADYREINPIFGTMGDVEELIAEAGKRGIGLMLDMVFNHTSTQHKWFQKALGGDREYLDYYIFRDGAEARRLPTGSPNSAAAHGNMCPALGNGTCTCLTGRRRT